MLSSLITSKEAGKFFLCKACLLCYTFQTYCHAYSRYAFSFNTYTCIWQVVTCKCVPDTRNVKPHTTGQPPKCTCTCGPDANGVPLLIDHSSMVINTGMCILYRPHIHLPSQQFYSSSDFWVCRAKRPASAKYICTRRAAKQHG